MRFLSKIIFALCFLFFIVSHSFSQELYVFSEPASNMPAHSLSFKLAGKYAVNTDISRTYQRYTPEVMLGLNKKLMVHLAGTFSNYYTKNLRSESIRGYMKYRFFSNDDVHTHFRMAAFAEGSYTQAPSFFEEMNLEGDNSGLQGGLIATQLVNKFAVSGTLSYMRAFRDQDNHLQHFEHSQNMIAYSLSAGYLVLPRNYTDFNQVNLNVYLEMLGLKAIDKPQYNIDLAPALQLIFNSTTKLNFGARFEVGSNILRIARTSYLVSVEQSLLNVIKNRNKGSNH